MKVPELCGDLVRSFLRAGYKLEEIRGLWARSVCAVCLECHIQVTGEELFTLALPPDREQASEKLNRMRLGYCARKGCQSWTYSLVFSPSAPVDWTRLLADAAVIHDELAGRGCGSRREWHFRLNPGMRRPAIVLAAMLALLVAREWWLGGRIPLVREPEKFRVDVAPESDFERHQTSWRME